MSPLDLLTMEKEVVGSIFGSSSPGEDAPRLVGLCCDGLVDLDRMVIGHYQE
jgi:Zn-dependent alcohol dehydrogenase